MTIKRCVLYALAIMASVSGVYAQTGTIRGVVLDMKTQKPLLSAFVSADNHQLRAITDSRGRFVINNVPYGKTAISVTYLGYETYHTEISADDKTPELKILMKEKSLVLDEVTVMAERNSGDATTSYTIGRMAIDHMQAVSVTDVASLLPGGQSSTTNTLTSSRVFALRNGPSGTSELGNSSFGTAVEIDGVRLSNNATFYESVNYRLSPNTLFQPYGTDVRNISSSNVESIEVITGVVSVEHGDLTNGMVKINTIKGRTPFTAEFVTKPNIKQYALGKGVGFGERGGVLNIHAERTESISDIASPYTTYDRNVLSLNYSNAFRGELSTLMLRAGFSCNIGGYDTKPDPDLYKDTYTKIKDNSLRGNAELNWLLNRRWITDVEASGSVNYADKRYTNREYKSNSGETISVRATEEGYYYGQSFEENPDAGVILIPAGSWYQMAYNDSRMLTYSAKAKARWVRMFGRVNNRIMAGAEYTSTGNTGRGTYYEDPATAPSWREQRYSDLPRMNNLAAYVEERADIALGATSLQLTAGLRSEWTMIKGTEYGTVNSLSPRFNLKYDIPFRDGSAISGLTLRGGYGKAVKLPSFAVLYPLTYYTDISVFTPLSAYYSYPKEMYCNPDLKWQYDRLREIGLDMDIKGIRISLSFFDNKTFNPYTDTNIFEPVTYRYTDYNAASPLGIAQEDRIYTIDPRTGTVTVADRTGAVATQELPYTDVATYKTVSTRTNGSPVVRRGLEWVVDFGRIESIRTSFRLDGRYYYYRSVDETIYGVIPTKSGAFPSTYVAYYAGSGTWNGSVSRQTNLNLTVTTHIPEARLILSMRVESSLYRMSRYLSEYQGSTLGFVTDEKGGLHPSADGGSIYDGDRFVAVYPLYYTTHDDPATKIPFAEKFEWARDNDPALYQELARMVKTTNYNYQFNKQGVSPYFTASIAVTKEIGRIASLTFNASNFFNNTSRIRESWTDTETSSYGHRFIPAFYYGLSLRLKL